MSPLSIARPASDRTASSRSGRRCSAVPPLALSAFEIPKFLKADAQDVVRLTVVGIVLDHGFEGCNGVLGTSATDLHLAAIDQRVIVARIRLQNLGVESARLAQTDPFCRRSSM